MSLPLNPLLTIIIVSYTDKRLNDLRELLDSIENQTYRFIELVFVIENSTVVNEFASNYRSKFLKKVFFTEARLGPSKARNLGVDLCSGEIVAFVDDDAILPAAWAEKLIFDFGHHQQAIGVTGRALPAWREMKNPSFPKSLYWMIGCTAWHDSDKEYFSNFVIGVNMAFRREAFCSHKFSTDVGSPADPNQRAPSKIFLPGEDVDFAVRLTADTGRQILYDPKLAVFHKVYPERMHSKFIRNYAFWQGFAEARYNSIADLKANRSSSYYKLSKIMARDFIDLSGSLRKSIWKSKVLLTAILFFLYGYLSYKDKRAYRLSQHFL